FPKKDTGRHLVHILSKHTLKFDNEIYYRRTHFIDDGKVTLKKLEKRLCWKGAQSDHDICHLYIDYKYIGFGSRHTECIEVRDIRTDEELERIEKLVDEGDYELDEYISGYCRKQDDGTIIITFGKNSEALLKKLN
ncbi:MAG: hypothetical protein K2O41_02670, partial [Clostridia bacterium]|nr:hypothetical protein [Clostridia bacterium]